MGAGMTDASEFMRRIEGDFEVLDSSGTCFFFDEELDFQ